MIDAPRIVQAPAQRTAFVRITVPRDQIQKVMGPGLEELRAAVAAQGVAVTGPWFTHHLRMDPATFDLEICLPVAAPVTAVGRVRPGELPAARVARTVYRGPYEGLSAAWGKLMAWMKGAGHEPRADLWEVYASGPESSPDPSRWRTELNRPVAG